MSTETIECVTLFEALPTAKRAEVTDFARFLLERSTGSYGLNAASRQLHAKAQTARRKGLSREFTGDTEELVRL